MSGPTSTEREGRVAGPNPFPGPRPFEPDERIYGRDKEIRELRLLLQAERIILFHAPSGAGKSSLIQAEEGLLSRLERTFDVWAPARVHQEPPAGLARNRYALSVMQHFEQDLPERHRRGASELVGRRLHEYVESRPRKRSAPANVLLVFDQFEEILTTDRSGEDAKKAFFDELGEALRNPHVWALFILREDYLAPLDPYARRVPTHFKNRFRMDLLGLAGAKDAMVEPARTGGRTFPAVDQLLRDLAKVNEQQPDGSVREVDGQHVEPVQLQVVCRRLWDTMPADDLQIDPEDVEQFGDVSGALGGYYADSLAKVVADNLADEMSIREWFGEKLITSSGFRSQVLREQDRSAGLDNKLIDALRESHLLRPERRGRATWYELAHDRLVEPVRQDNKRWWNKHIDLLQRQASISRSLARAAGGNDADERRIREWIDNKLITAQGARGQIKREEAQSGDLENSLVDAMLESNLIKPERRGEAIWYELADDRLIDPIRQNNERWREKHLHPVQRRAELWDKEDKSENLLLVDAELQSAEEWADSVAKSGGALTKTEELFLDGCRREQQRREDKHREAEREQRQTRRIKQFARGSSVLAALAVIVLPGT